jgi:cytochrome c
MLAAMAGEPFPAMGFAGIAGTARPARVAIRPKAARLYGLPQDAQSLYFRAIPASGETGLPMDSFEFNKIAGAVLGTALGVMAISIISEAVFNAGEPAKPGFEIAVTEAPAAGAGSSGAAPAVAPIADRLAKADPAAGKQIAAKCLACHTLDKGQPAKIGPNLYGIVGDPAAHMEGFKYSKAMEDKRAAGWVWTFDNLDHFITQPKAEIPGTAMGFAGLPKPEDRANVIAYLNTLSDKPLPLPAPGAAAAPASAAPASAAEAAPASAAPASGEAAPASAAPQNNAAPVTETAPAIGAPASVAPAAPASEAAPASAAPSTSP